MSRYCDICHRGPYMSIKRSHSNIANKKRQYLNLQTVRVNGKKMTVCTKCLKTLKKQNKIIRKISGRGPEA